MKRSKINFQDLRTFCDWVEKDDNESICAYFNTFEGNNTFDKFKNILKCWECDVSDVITVNSDNRSLKIQLSYIIGELPKEINSPQTLNYSGLDIGTNIPNIFTHTENMVPIYELIQYLCISNTIINLIDLSIFEKHQVIDKLPPKIYNYILEKIIETQTGIVSFSNKSLSSLRMNFFTYDPFNFLKGLFANYTKDYFRDIIYHLSNKIDGNILLQSDLKDIEYYILKFNDEVKNQQEKMDA